MDGDPRKRALTIWKNVTLPLPIYWNEEKLDELVAQTIGELITERTRSVGSTRERSTQATTKLGSLLALFGVGELSGTVGSRAAHQQVETALANVTFTDKMEALLQVFGGREALAYYDLLDGYELTPDHTEPIEHWQPTALADSLREGLAWIYGAYHPLRVTPDDGKVDLLDDALHHRPVLWTFAPALGSVYQCEIPFLASRIRLGSQHAAIAMHKKLHAAEAMKIGAFGILRKAEGSYTLDPIQFEFLYDGIDRDR
ncbi:MAG: hypothetical protein QOG01_348 [Pseudonocardiales bacterium]|jgi:hypothetical protein|nr:hypothetical protein [Pseudonocardiales bacterium]